MQQGLMTMLQTKVRTLAPMLASMMSPVSPAWAPPGMAPALTSSVEDEKHAHLIAQIRQFEERDVAKAKRKAERAAKKAKDAEMAAERAKIEAEVRLRVEAEVAKFKKNMEKGSRRRPVEPGQIICFADRIGSPHFACRI